MLINKNVLRALNLSPDETILLNIRPHLEKSSPNSSIHDILKFRLITTKKIVHLDYYFRKQTAQITDSLPFEQITDLKLNMRHTSQKKEPLFYIAATKAPMLEIKTTDQSYIFSLRGILFLKKKMNTLVGCVKKANPHAIVSLNYKRDDMGEAYREILFDGIDDKKKPRLMLLIILLGLLLSIATWRAFYHLKTFTGY